MFTLFLVYGLLILGVSGRFPCYRAGFFRDPSNCRQFYRCVQWYGKHFTAFEFDCPAGTFFDESIMVCNHKRNVLDCVDTDRVDDDISHAGLLIHEPIEQSQPASSGIGEEPTISQSVQIVSDNAGLILSEDKPAFSDIAEAPTVSQSIQVELDNARPTGPSSGESTFLDFGHRPVSSHENFLSTDSTTTIATTTTLFVSKSPRPFVPLFTNDISSTTPKPFSEEKANDTTTESPSPNESNYTVDPFSLYPCPNPGFFPFISNCNQFYVCNEIRPGILIADQLYSCPNRYLFDEETFRCQKMTKVNCTKFELNNFEDSLSAKENILVVHEQFLDLFFSTPLGYSPSGRTKK